MFSNINFSRIACILLLYFPLLTFGASKTVVYDFTNPALWGLIQSDETSSTLDISNRDFNIDPISITFSKHEGSQFPRYSFTYNYIKISKNNRLTVKSTVSGANIIAINIFTSVTTVKSEDFLVTEQTQTNISAYNNKWSVNSVSDFLFNLDCYNARNITKIEVEYEVADTPVKIEDMPEGLECKKFDVARVIREGINYVLVSGNYVATGKLNENGHLNVVRFTSENGEINIPMQYAFNLTGCDNDAFYISNNENKFLAADAAGHFSLTEDELEATAWEILTGSDGDIKISEAVAVSRAAGKSVMFSEQEGGFGRYDIDDATAQAPVLYAYADNTTSIITEIADEMKNQAEYFDLRGNRVDINHAANGIYICRNGKRVTKVAILR